MLGFLFEMTDQCQHGACTEDGFTYEKPTELFASHVDLMIDFRGTVCGNNPIVCDGSTHMPGNLRG